MSVFDVALPETGAPQFVVDRAQVEQNLASLVQAAGGVPLRIATKSVRVRPIVEWATSQPGVGGLLTYSAAESLWLVQHGAQDVLVAYPTVDRVTVRAIAADEVARREITFMADLPEHIELLASEARAAGGTVRVAFDIDCAYRVGRVAIGAHRSSLRSPQDAARLGAVVERTPGVELVGAMFYEAQVAGVQDLSAAHRLLKRCSMAELAERRGAVVRAMNDFGDITIVNGGGTGSVHWTSQDATVTDIAVGSGLFTPHLFDHYDDLSTKPAAWFVTPIVRKPSHDVVVTFSGGYHASGQAGTSRLPEPTWPRGLKYFSQEGAGEVQTPLHGEAAEALGIGDRVWFRHAKAGEVMERFNEVHVINGGAEQFALRTYRGEGKNFG